MNELLGKDIKEKLSSLIQPLKMDLIISKGAYSGYLHFSFEEGKVEKKRSLGPYENIPLLRNLLGKSDLISSEVREKLYQTNEGIICILHEWDENNRKALLFHTDNVDFFNEPKFLEFFKHNGSTLDRWFSYLESKSIGSDR